MPEYTRPVVVAGQFRDESGAVIHYGTRWADLPPEDSYSRVSNPERFAPLLAVADALIEHLRAGYLADVAVLENSGAGDAPATTKLIAVTPENLDAAPLVFRFTAFPGVQVQAGVRYNVAFPICGCDACDEAWGSVADELERLVLAVSDGRFSERIVLPQQATGTASFEHTIEGPGQRAAVGVRHGLLVDPELRADAARLDRLPNGRWAPWGR